MGGLNPVEWFAWLYGKVFQNNVWLGGALVTVLFGCIGLLLWIRGVDKYKEEHPQKTAVETIDPKPQAVTVSNSVSQTSVTAQNKSASGPRKRNVTRSKLTPPQTLQVQQTNSGGINVQQFTSGEHSPILNSPITINAPASVLYNYDGSEKVMMSGGSVSAERRDPNEILIRSQSELAAGQSEKALADANELMNAAPEWASPHVIAGLAYLNQGKLEDAKNELHRAKSLVPNGYRFAADYEPHLKHLEEAIHEHEPIR